MSGVQDAMRAVFGEDVVPDPNRVLDPSALVVGDRIRLEIEGEVAEAGPLVSLKVYDDWHPWVFATERLAAPKVRVYRLPKPLPPEPPVGAEVLGQDGEIRFRRTMDGWCSLPSCRARTDCPACHEAWRDVLVNFGPVRLLGDPIEAP